MLVGKLLLLHCTIYCTNAYTASCACYTTCSIWTCNPCKLCLSNFTFAIQVAMPAAYVVLVFTICITSCLTFCNADCNLPTYLGSSITLAIRPYIYWAYSLTFSNCLHIINAMFSLIPIFIGVLKKVPVIFSSQIQLTQQEHAEQWQKKKKNPTKVNLLSIKTIINNNSARNISTKFGMLHQ